MKISVKGENVADFGYNKSSVTETNWDGRIIQETKEEIDAKNKIHFQNAQAAAARIIAESNRHKKATAERLAREAAEQNK